ncbi:F1F0-ATPase subunit [Scheffersomyces stipitis CBS 6054]|uniref:ATP synthase subunit 5, mitochondrial n=1 Tax=Scheffersomyces stipitis (strain ATCC 58785 / CBS 6054 / NBRC 10063 / NRRL Y-11545) TaxID=322104 RepID=A3LNI0_PICST|nr:F1F0-ATPase subunit [Scheffersomyces stipitis CBS 6054]ABN64337.1 F1F0-ATPase subunit [Scheffersomyces stipitis CBS 6054]
MSSRVFFRSLASSAKSVKPPVQLYGIDGTYANALYSASVQDSSVEASFQSLTKINNLIQSDSKVAEFLANPAVNKADRDSVVKVIESTLKLDKTTGNFLSVLAQNNRLTIFKSIYEKFSLLNDAHNGLVEAKVTSAKPLDSKILKRLQTSISKSALVGEGKTLKLTNNVNPEILGGLVVEVGEQTVDLSVQSKVSKLNQTLKEAL